MMTLVAYIGAAMLTTVSTLPTVTADSSSSDVLSWTIYHSWNPQQDFVKRGSISWNKNNNDVAESSTDDSSILEITNEKEVSPEDIAAMLEYGWYHIKLVPDSNPNDVVLGTVPACHVRRANFKDVFDITLPRSGDQDHILSFAYTPLVSPLAPKSCDEYSPAEAAKAFQSKTSVKLDTPGLALKPVLAAAKPPPGVQFLKRPRDANTAKNNQENNGGNEGSSTEPDYEDPEPKPEPPSGIFGFLQRYWYMILPMVVMQFLAPPPQEDPQQSAQGGQPAQGAAPATATAPAHGGGGQKRRGKRN